jgi:hypothetical protein
MLHFELLDEMFDHSVVNVLTPQVAVSFCGLYLKDSIFDVEQGDIKGAPPRSKIRTLFSIDLSVIEWKWIIGISN